MIGIIVLGLLCLAAASVLLRAVLFVLDKRNHEPLAKVASIVRAIGFSPLIAFEWAYYLATTCVLIALAVYCFG
jgi:hypothetical protein